MTDYPFAPTGTADLPDLAPPPAITGHGGAAAAAATRFESPGPSLTQLLTVLRAYRRSALLIVATVLVLTAGVIAVWPRAYLATAALMVNYQVNDPLNGKELPVGQVSNFIATQVELMRSPELVNAVVDRLQLTTQPAYRAGYNPGQGTLRDWVSAQVTKRLSVVPSQMGSQLIYVAYTAPSRERAMLVADTVIAVYREQQQVRAVGLPGARAVRNGTEVAVLKGKVDATRQQLQSFQQAHGLISDDGKADVEGMALANLEGRLLEAQNARRMAEARQQGDAAVSDQALASGLAQGTRAQLAAKELQLAQLSRSYGEAYPGLREVRQQVDDLRAALGRINRMYADNASASLTAARDLEARLQGAVGAQRSRVDGLGRRRVEAGRFQLEFEAAQKAYRQALEGTDQINFAASGQPYTNVVLVSRATAPLAPSAPKVLTLALLGLLAGLGLGAGLPLLYELTHRRIRCRDDLERGFGVAVLAEFRPCLPGSAA